MTAARSICSSRVLHKSNIMRPKSLFCGSQILKARLLLQQNMNFYVTMDEVLVGKQFFKQQLHLLYPFLNQLYNKDAYFNSSIKIEKSIQLLSAHSAYFLPQSKRKFCVFINSLNGLFSAIKKITKTFSPFLQNLMIFSLIKAPITLWANFALSSARKILIPHVNFCHKRC